jgi:hypothetical protein
MSRGPNVGIVHTQCAQFERTADHSEISDHSLVSLEV